MALIGDLQYRFELELEANARLVLDNPFEVRIAKRAFWSVFQSLQQFVCTVHFLAVRSVYYESHRFTDT